MSGYKTDEENWREFWMMVQPTVCWMLFQNSILRKIESSVDRGLFPLLILTLTSPPSPKLLEWRVGTAKCMWFAYPSLGWWIAFRGSFPLLRSKIYQLQQTNNSLKCKGTAKGKLTTRGVCTCSSVFACPEDVDWFKYWVLYTYWLSVTLPLGTCVYMNISLYTIDLVPVESVFPLYMTECHSF